MADENLVTFEEAMEMLGVDEDRLLDLVAANELRAFRADREMKFRAEDVRSYSDHVGSASAETTPEVPPAEDVEVVEVEAGDLLDEPDTIEATPVVTAEAASAEPVFEAEAGEDLPTIPTEDVVEVEEDDLLMVDEESSPDEAERPTVVIPRSEAEAAGATESTTPDDDDEPTILIDESDVVSESPDIVFEEDSGQDETILETPSSGGLGTEEIIFDDEDLEIDLGGDETIGTQELTVQEEAVSLDEAAPSEDEMELTLTSDAITVQDEPEEAESAPAGETVRKRRRPPASARASARASSADSFRRRGIEETPISGNPVLSGVLVLTALLMLYPLSMFIAVLQHGYTTLPSRSTGGRVALNGTVPELGVLFVPEHLRPLRGQLGDLWGRPESIDDESDILPDEIKPRPKEEAFEAIPEDEMPPEGEAGMTGEAFEGEMGATPLEAPAGEAAGTLGAAEGEEILPPPGPPADMIEQDEPGATPVPAEEAPAEDAEAAPAEDAGVAPAEEGAGEAEGAAPAPEAAAEPAADDTPPADGEEAAEEAAPAPAEEGEAAPEAPAEEEAFGPAPE